MGIYDTAGSGVPLVFLHAGICDRRMWHPQWDHFADSNQVIRIDGRGFGENPPSDEPFNRAADVIEILESLGVEQAVLVGGSMGGRVSLEIAVRRPDLVAGLVLLGAAVPGHDWVAEVQDVWRAESAALDAGDIDTAVAVNLDFWLDGPNRDRANVNDTDRQLVADMQRQSLVYEAAYPDAAAETPLDDLVERLGEIESRTLVIYGDQDASDIAVIANMLATVLPNATMHEIDDTAHLPSLEAPAEVNSLLAGLLDELASGLA